MCCIARFVCILLAAGGIHSSIAEGQTLREVYQDDFLIGVALNSRIVDGRATQAAELAAKQFSSLTAENDMKWQLIHPEPGRYTFKAADAYFEFAKKNKMEVIGHALIWHSQVPSWVFEGDGGKLATRQQLLDRMRDHIHIVAGRYKGKVRGWDVVNEALSDGGPDILRDSPWRRIIGDDFIDHAFRFAKEADPEAELYYNDYGLEDPRKRENCVKLLKGMLERKVPISGVGTQSHFHLDGPSVQEIEKTITELSGLGLKVMITELDIDVLPRAGSIGNADVNRQEQGDPTSNPFVDGLPTDIEGKLARRYSELFDVYLRHRKSIARVTFWGLSDGDSWLNFFPIRGRTNHPLLFDRELNPKPAFDVLIRKGKDDGSR